MAPGRERPSPIDKYTDASASAISSGFTAAMSLGPQPGKTTTPQRDPEPGTSEGVDWLRKLQEASGMLGVDSSSEFDLGAAFGVAGTQIGGLDDHSDDEDGDSEADSQPSHGGSKKKAKKGRGKAKEKKLTNDESTAAQRKAQNRIAQREFRQRKQQYIRALEARVELLSSDHDTQVDRLRFALRGLLTENNQLRSILGNVASFIGSSMIGGPLQKSGMSRAELEDILSNSSEKTMTEIWQNWPGAKECEALRQIRLESNLPPEGLPESQKLTEQAIANTAAARQQLIVNAHGSPASVHTDKSVATKRKETTDEEQASSASKRRHQSKAIEDNNGKPRPKQQAMGVMNQVPSASSPLAVSKLPELYDDQQNAHFANLFANSQLPNTFDSPDQISPIQHSKDQNPATHQVQSQDSSAILASLFGVDGMSGFIGQQTPFLPSHPAVNTRADNDSHLKVLRPKSFASAEEPEEIKRLNEFAHQLRTDEMRFGGPKEEVELKRIVDGFSTLIHEMANFRRQPSYRLPALLEPNDIQQTRPHDPFLDALPFSGLRQRLIEHQDNLVLDDVLLSFIYHTELHPGDVTEESNWEVRQGFLFTYPQLLDRKVLAYGNLWRATRDESTYSYESLTELER
ncbi:hypothetical protein CBS101457_002653 [Exobasidium rhododendri]|nr:hypothetical protein CBS101457_002653 [Exobasidium rhododendri]